MTREHPITPPPELVEKWRDEALNSFPDDENPCPCDLDDARDEHIATQAARWGADAELEACCEWISGRDWTWTTAQLRTARRPKPPSLKEQALDLLELDDGSGLYEVSFTPEHLAIIRRALEALPD